MAMAQHNDTGRWGEDYAEAYLRQQGYILRDRDWSPAGSHRDLDLVMLTADLTTLVFVEVKTRTVADLADPADAVDEKKIRNLGYAANEYVKAHNVVEELRFDVVCIVGCQGHVERVEHIEDAFNPTLL